MDDNRISALEARIGNLETDLEAMTNALVTVLSQMTAGDPRRKRIAERLRTVGDVPAMKSARARHLMDTIADRIETAGT